MNTYLIIMFLTLVVEAFLAGVHHAAVARKRAGLIDTCTIRVSELVR
jgi:hypothetical protein